MLYTGIMDGQMPRPSLFARPLPSTSFDRNTKAVSADSAVAMLFNGIFVDIGNVVNGLAPFVDWRALYRHLLTEVIGAPDGSRFDTNVCFYHVRSRPEQDAAQELQRATGAATVASSLQKNDSDVRLIGNVRFFIDRFVPNGVKPPYGYIVLVTGDADFSELVEFSAERGFIPLVVSFSDRISHALVQKIYECRGDTLELDRFAVPTDVQHGRPVPRSFDPSPTDVFAPAFDPAPRPAPAPAFPERPAARPVQGSFMGRPAGGSGPADEEPPHSAPAPVRPKHPAPSAPEVLGRGGIFEDGDDGAESVPKFDEREKVQNFVVAHVLKQLGSDVVLDGLDRRLMRTITGLWVNGHTPTFSHTAATIASRTGQSEETVSQRLHNLLVDELLVTRELRYQLGGATRVSQALVPTRRGIAAARLTPSPVPNSSLSGSLFRE